MIYVYPKTGVPGMPLLDGWNEIAPEVALRSRVPFGITTLNHIDRDDHSQGVDSVFPPDHNSSEVMEWLRTQGTD